MFGTFEALLSLKKYLRGITEYLELALSIGLSLFTLGFSLANLLGQAKGPFYRQTYGITPHLILSVTRIG